MVDKAKRLGTNSRTLSELKIKKRPTQTTCRDFREMNRLRPVYELLMSSPGDSLFRHENGQVGSGGRYSLLSAVGLGLEARFLSLKHCEVENR